MRMATPLLALLLACGSTTPPPPPPVEPEPPEPVATEPALEPDPAWVGVWESHPGVGEEPPAPVRLVLAADGRYVWQAAEHVDPASGSDPSEGYERFGRWGMVGGKLEFHEERRLESQLAFVGCPDGGDDCDCTDCACEACEPTEGEQAEGACPCAWGTEQRVHDEPVVSSLDVATECPAETLAKLDLGERADAIEAPCRLIGGAAYWRLGDETAATERITDAWH